MRIFFSLLVLCCLSLTFFTPQTYAQGIPLPTDLDVTYITRTPRYYRYCLTYPNNIPTLCPGTANRKQWPDVGETVTYEAHATVKLVPYSGVLIGTWKVDGVAVASQSASFSIQPHQDTVVGTYSMPWSATRQNIQFSLSLPSNNSDTYAQNNQLTIGTHDLTLSYWVEDDLYSRFNTKLNGMGTYSFEDWMNWHVAQINQRLAAAVYPNSSPNGVIDRVRIDKFVRAAQIDGPNSPQGLDPDKELFDGTWQTTDGDVTNVNGANGFNEQYANQFAATIDWGWLHEVLHQLGAPDLYRLNLPNFAPELNDGIQVTNYFGSLLTKYMLPNDGIMFMYGGIMGGGDRRPYPDGTYLSSHTAAGLVSNTGKRRGHFGEYFFDVPATVKIRVLDVTGAVIPNATVKLYQRGISDEKFDNTPEITVTTNSSGIATLPNRTVTGVTTATGHTLANNPFGQIHVVGLNGSMIVKVAKDKHEGAGFLLLTDLNVAYRSGQTTQATIDVPTTFRRVKVKDTTVAGNLLQDTIDTNFTCEYGRWCRWFRNGYSYAFISPIDSLSIEAVQTTGDYGSCWIQWVQGAKADGSTYRIKADFESTFPAGTGFPKATVQVQTMNKNPYKYWAATAGTTSLNETVTVTDAYQDFVAVKFCSWGTNVPQSYYATLKKISFEKL